MVKYTAKSRAYNLGVEGTAHKEKDIKGSAGRTTDMFRACYKSRRGTDRTNGDESAVARPGGDS